MKIYLVGGAVRDELLGRPIKDRDYVVVGSTPAEMISLGYDQVGADFPVFLHPETREEYALARTERKSGTGYNGFTVNADPSITLEQDLMRRDLTMNSMARDLETGELIDPFGGEQDLKNGILRHTSPAFAEDPLRVLRVARFAARYNFNIAPDTLVLMTKLVERREMEALTTERVWLEFEKALMEANPCRFITSLWRCEAWLHLFSGVNAGAAMHALNKAAVENLTFDERIACLFSETHLEIVDRCLLRYKVSAELTRLVHNVSKTRRTIDSMGMSYFRADPLEMLKTLDAFRRPDGLKQVCNVLRCMGYGKTVLLADELEAAYAATAPITFGTLPAEQQKLKGAEVGKAIDHLRQRALSELTFAS